MPQPNPIKLVQILCLTISGWQLAILLVLANNLPPATDIPEEILRTEIITEARSPIDGTPLSAADFAELIVKVERQTSLDDATAATNNPAIKDILFLVRLRSFLRSVGIPIK